MIAGLFILIYLAVIVACIAGAWKTYAKAGQPGWGVLIPIYNIYLWLKIAGKPGWWLLLYLIPVVNFVIAILVAIEIAKAFGKGGGFVVLLILLPFIALPMLGFGSATYTAPKAA